MGTNMIQNFISSSIVVAGVALAFVSQNAFAQQSESGKKFANGMVLDFYAFEDPKVDASAGPSGRSVGAVIDHNVPKMNYAAASDLDADFNAYTQSWYGQMWSGYLRVLNDGVHTLNVQYSFDPAGSSAWVQCVTKLHFEGEEVVSFQSAGNRTNTKVFENAFYDETLKPGLYKIGVWIGCSGGDRVQKYNQIEVMLKMRGPNDRKQRPIPSENLFYIEN